MITAKHERTLLQICVFAACMVPLFVGTEGALDGLSFLHAGGDAMANSHFRYLSGMLLAIGILFLKTIRRIEHFGKIFIVLTFIVVAGGLIRLESAIETGINGPIIFALMMELIVTPALCIWQHRIARLFNIR